MKKFLIVLFFIISCKQNEVDDYFESLDFKLHIQKQDLKDQPPPPPISLVTIVLPISENGERYEVITDNLSGKKIYEENFKSKFVSYPEFLEELSKQNFYIKANLLNNFYFSKLNKEDSIFIEYKTRGFNFILNKYTIKETSEKWRSYYILYFADLPTESENSLLSIMYKQKYYVTLDDYAAHYSFFKDKK